MRDINRLDDFYDTMKDLHKKYIPDWRFGQTICNFAGWFYNKYKRDWFFTEEEDTLKYFKEYLKDEFGIKEV